MSEHSKHDDSVSGTSDEQDVVVLLKRMQQHLAFLEKKIDILVAKSQERPFRQKPFSRPFRPSSYHRRPEGEYVNTSEEKRFDRPRRFEKRHGREERGFGYKKESYGSPRESSFTKEHSFEKRHGREERDFGHKKESYGKPREGGFTQERPFEKRHGQDKRGFDPKKKPFYLKRKDRG